MASFIFCSKFSWSPSEFSFGLVDSTQSPSRVINCSTDITSVFGGSFTELWPTPRKNLSCGRLGCDLERSSVSTLADPRNSDLERRCENSLPSVTPAPARKANRLPSEKGIKPRPEVTMRRGPGIFRWLCRTAALCPQATARARPPTEWLQHWTVREGRPPVRNSQVSGSRSRDYSLPNASWSKTMRSLYDKYMGWTQDGTWKRLPSYNRGLVLEGDEDSPNRLFTRNSEVEGSCFEYAMFMNKAEKRVLCIFQPGPLLEGPPHHVHGGATLALLDGVTGQCAYAFAGPVLTANVNINFRSPMPLGRAVVLDAWIEEVKGLKLLLSCQVTSGDGSTVHADGRILFVKYLGDVA